MKIYICMAAADDSSISMGVMEWANQPHEERFHIIDYSGFLLRGVRGFMERCFGVGPPGGVPDFQGAPPPFAIRRIVPPLGKW